MARSISHTRAILYALAGFTFWVFADASLKFVAASSLPKYEIVTLMSLCAVAAVAVITFLRGKIRNLRPRRPKLLVVLGFILLTNILSLLVAFRHLPLTSVYAITFISPILTAVLAAILLHERVSWQQGLAILIGFSGVIIAIDPFRSMAVTGDLLGYAAAFVSVSLNTINLLLLRFYGDAEHSESMAFYPRVVAGLAGLIPCVFWRFESAGFAQLAPPMLAGFLAGIGWLFITVACKMAPASIVAPFRYSQIIAGAILGYLVWSDVPTQNLVAGVAIIIASGLYFARRVVRKEELMPMGIES